MGVKLELLTDPDMLLMFECDIRGGITQAVHRYVKANRKYMSKKFKPKEVISFLQYLDANNLYGWAVIQLLPTGGFKWIGDVSRFTPDEIDKLVKIDNKGYLLEVDVKYPKELHHLHNELLMSASSDRLGLFSELIFGGHRIYGNKER